MLGLLTAVHLLIAIVLILIVLVQSAKGTDVGSAFGGMGGQATFGPRGTTTFLSKATIGLAAAFMVTSVALSIMGRGVTSGGESILSGEENAPAQTEPGTTSPAAQPAGSPPVVVDTKGLPGVTTTVTVENPEKTPSGTAPAATTQPGAVTPSAPAAAPAGQPTGQPATPPSNPPAAPSGQ